MNALLETARLRLRPWTVDDAVRAAPIFADPATMATYDDREPWDTARLRREVARWIESQESRGFSLWAVERRDTGELIGGCGFLDCEDTGELEIHFVIARSQWGQGFATEAARAAVEHGAGPLGLPRIAGVVWPGNAASEAVLRKLGFAFERRIPFFGAEALLYALTRPERPA